MNDREGRVSKSALPGVLVFALILGGGVLDVRGDVDYRLSFPNAVHHEAQIVATLTDLPAGPVTIQMSRSSPGRYALHEFVRQVYGERFTNAEGEDLVVERIDPYRWVASGHNGTIRITYTLFGARADGTYNGITSRYVQLNAPATFLWSPAAKSMPIRVRFERPNLDWTIATQLYPTEDPDAFEAPDLDYLMDSPVHIGQLAWREWTIGAEGDAQVIRLAVNHPGTEEEMDELTQKAKEIVDLQIEMWGEAPTFDGGTYTFIANYQPDASGDGMEHRNSTMLSSSKPLSNNMMNALSTLSHEFFHAWNVERLRPASLEPFDFERANMASELWFAEGFTAYYDSLFLRRAGIIDDEKWGRDLTTMLDSIVNSPGRSLASAADMSRRAPFVDRSSSVDPSNTGNTFVSYYTWGSGIALGLDLTLRVRYQSSLDHYLRELWTRFGRSETPFTSRDLEEVLADVTGDAGFATDFFKRFIDGKEIVDYPELLSNAGFELRRKREDQGWLGSDMEEKDGRIVVANLVRTGSPFYEAGLEQGDVLTEANGNKITGPGYMDAIADFVPPGMSVEIKYERAGEEGTTTMILTKDPSIEVVPFEKSDRAISESVREFRLNWLGPAPIEDTEADSEDSSSAATAR